MVKANKDKNVEIPEHEKHLMHIRLRIPGIDQVTEQPLNKPYITTFTVDEYIAMDKENQFKGKIVQVVHDARTEDQIKEDVGNDNPAKPLSRMNKAELVEAYGIEFDITPGEDVEAMTMDELRTHIADSRQKRAEEDEAANKKAADEAAKNK